MLLVGNGKVITKDSENPYLEDGAVVIEDGLIKEIGKTADLKQKYAGAEWIDAKGNVIMPGLLNTHMHIYSAFARGMASKGPAPRNFQDVLENLWWRLDKGLTLEDTKYSAYTTLIDCIKNGTTTVFDHHASPYAIEGSLFTIAEVAKELGIRTSLCYETSDRDGLEIARQGIKENVDFIKYANKDDQNMVKGMFGMHAAFTLSDQTLEESGKAMAGLPAGYHIHVAEGMEDLQHSLKHYGKRVVERLYDYGIMGEKTIAVHCIYVNEREMQILEDTKTNVVHNPESNMGNAVGCSPALHMMAHGINVGLGTDGYTSDMFESIKVANILHKHHLCNPSVAWGEVPQMANENNQKIVAQYFNQEMGVLKPGAVGDVIIVEYDPLTDLNGDNANSHILFGMMGRSVTHTIVGGKVLMKDRELQGIDEKAIFAKSRQLANGLWSRI